MFVVGMLARVLTVLSIILVILVAGCGGGSGSSQDQANVVVSISPKSTSLTVMIQRVCNCAVQQFQATVTGGNTNAVDWLVNGIPGGNSSVGTISSSGLYMTPDEIPPSPITVSARSLANTSKTDSAIVTLSYPPATPTSVTPPKIKQGSGPVSVALSSGPLGPFSKFATADLNGMPLTVSNVSKTSLTVTIPASATVIQNALSITVQNPTPGGGGVGTSLYVVSGTFSVLPDMNTPRTGHTATLLQNGKVLITGGSDAGGAVLNNTELFDPATNTFRTAAAMRSARTRHSATLLLDGRVLIAGGAGDNVTSLSNFLNTAEIYDPVADVFAAVPNTMNFPHTVFAARLSNGKVLLQDGDADVYDPATNSFIAVSSNSDIRSTFVPPGFASSGFCPGIVVLPNSNTIILAGQPYLFDAPTLTYTPLTKGSTVFASKHDCAFVGLKTGEILTSGGGGNSFDMVNGGSVWDPVSLAVTDTFRFINVGQIMTRQVAVTLSSGKVLIFTPGLPTRAEIYDPARKGLTFIGPDPLPLTPDPPPPSPATPTATLLNDGRVLIIGIKAQIYIPQ